MYATCHLPESNADKSMDQSMGAMDEGGVLPLAGAQNVNPHVVTAVGARTLTADDFDDSYEDPLDAREVFGLLLLFPSSFLFLFFNISLRAIFV